MRPTILLDCDDILSDFTGLALKLIFDVTGEKHARSEVTTWEIFDSVAPHAKTAVYRLLERRGQAFSMEPIDGAKEGVAELHEFADIVVVTSPFWGSDTWPAERTLWIEKHFGKYIDHVIHARHKARIHGDLFVDDKPKNIKAWLDYWARSARDTRVVGIHWENGRTLKEVIDPLACHVTSWPEVHELVRLRSSMP